MSNNCKNEDYFILTIYKKRRIFNKIFIKQDIFFILFFSCINNIFCKEYNSSDKSKTIIILILLIVALVVIIILVILFIICFCCKKRQININNYLEGNIAFERGNQEEVELRERITNEGIHALSEYLKDKLITDVYSKKFELYSNKCPICLENFEEYKSVILISGCLHIFHFKCLSIFAEKVDLNKNIFSQFVCPTCRKNLIDGIDKIKNCIDIYPNFFGDIYKNKKITKMKHVKNLIEKILEEKKEIKDSSKESFENQKDLFNNKKNNNDNDKDISFDNINIAIPINKIKNPENNLKDIKENINNVQD